MNKLLKIATVFGLSIGLCACNTSENTEGSSSEEKPMYQYNDEQKYQKFWDDKVIYNETVCLVEENGEIFGKLLYTPTKIISVRDYTTQEEYSPDNYEVKGNKIYRTENSKLPYFTAENMKGENLPEGFGIDTMPGKEPGSKVMFTEGSGIVMHQINVTYEHNDTWSGAKPVYKGEELPNTISKLKNKEHLTIGWYGDSIMTGCNSSGKLGIAPYLDDFPTAASEQLKKIYGYEEIEYFNSSKGGMLSDWGETNVDALVNMYNPDLVFVGFGMNDGSFNVKPDVYVSRIETIINKIQLQNNNAEVVVVATILANPDSVQNLAQETYLEPLKVLCDTYDGVALMDMTSYSKYILEHKRSVDVYANNINHPSDFMVRGYTSNILQLLAEDYYA